MAALLNWLIWYLRYPVKSGDHGIPTARYRAWIETVAHWTVRLFWFLVWFGSGTLILLGSLYFFFVATRIL